MPRPQLPFMTLRKTSKFTTAHAVVRKLEKIVSTHGIKCDIRDMRKYAPWAQLVSILQYNPVNATIINGIPVAIGGTTSGRDNPHKTLQEIVTMRDWSTLQYHPSSTGTHCTVCNSEIGEDVIYTVYSGEKSLYNLPSLNISHSLPAIYGGCASVNNCVIECARCNKLRATAYDTDIDTWLKSVKIRIFE